MRQNGVLVILRVKAEAPRGGIWVDAQFVCSTGEKYSPRTLKLVPLKSGKMSGWQDDATKKEFSSVQFPPPALSH